MHQELLEALHKELTQIPAYSGVGPEDLQPLPFRGLAHDHVAILGTDQLLRVPKQSQFALSARDNLIYQESCFRRVSDSGFAPRLHGVIRPGPSVPMGALVVDHVRGRAPELPGDLPALAECMAAVHGMAVPEPEARAPLADHRDPVAGIMEEIAQQAAFLDAANLSTAARGEIDTELTWAREFLSDNCNSDQPICLVLTDTHPANFVIDQSGRAFIVDLEKALYGSAGIDLAHSSVYSSTTWDPDSYAELSLAEVASFYRHYLRSLPKARAEQLRPWLVPMRRLLFLRAITWCAKWQVLHRQSSLENKHERQSTEDWSAENSDAAVINHVAGRVDDYLSHASLRRMRGEWLDSPSLYDLF